MIKPRAKQRGAFLKTLFDSSKKDSPSCLADCFSWPQVALTHHVCSRVIETSPVRSVKTTPVVTGTLNCPHATTKLHSEASCIEEPVRRTDSPMATIKIKAYVYVRP